MNCCHLNSVLLWFIDKRRAKNKKLYAIHCILFGQLAFIISEVNWFVRIYYRSSVKTRLSMMWLVIMQFFKEIKFTCLGTLRSDFYFFMICKFLGAKSLLFHISKTCWRTVYFKLLIIRIFCFRNKRLNLNKIYLPWYIDFQWSETFPVVGD